MQPINQENTNHQLPLELDLQEAAKQLGKDGSPLLLDVREPQERAFCRLDDDLHIPTGAIPMQWKSLPRDKPLLVYCHHGMRSLRVTQFLRQSGLEHVQSLKGGIDAWSRHLDPSIPRY